jgi:hypothetical protein
MDEGVGQALLGYGPGGFLVKGAPEQIAPSVIHRDGPPGDELDGVLGAVAHVVRDARLEPHLDIPASVADDMGAHGQILDDRIAEGLFHPGPFHAVRIDVVDVEAGDVFQGWQVGEGMGDLPFDSGSACVKEVLLEPDLNP